MSDEESPERWVELEDHIIDIENPELPEPREQREQREPREPREPRQPHLDILLARSRSLAREEATEELLWCLRHRAVALTRPGVTTTSPNDFGVPTVPIRPGHLRFYERSDAQAFLREFVDETLKRASADSRCHPLSACDVVHPGGEFYRNGPYLWARIQNGRYVLIEVNLWPQLKADEGCFPRVLDIIDRLGVISMTDSPRLVDQAEQALGPNTYVGICPCDAW